MKYISSCLVACAIAAASAPAAAVTVTLDFTSAPFTGYPSYLAANYGNGNGVADFTWTGVEVYTPSATAALNNSIYSASGNVLIAALGGQTISQIAFDYFTYYDSDILDLTNTNTWSLLDGGGVSRFSGIMSAPGGPDNSGKAVQSFVQNVTPGLYSTLKLTFSNNEAMGFDNFSVTAVPAIPEPETYALMLAGLGLVGFMARRRKAK